MTLASTTPISTFEKSIGYDRLTKDYAAYLDGQLIGWFNSYHDAEVELNRVAYDWLTHGYNRTASELDTKQSEHAEGDAPFCFFCPGADHNTDRCPKLETEAAEA